MESWDCRALDSSITILRGPELSGKTDFVLSLLVRNAHCNLQLKVLGHTDDMVQACRWGMDTGAFRNDHHSYSCAGQKKPTKSWGKSHESFLPEAP